MYSLFLTLIIAFTVLLCVYSYNKTKSIILCFPLFAYILWFFIGFSVTEQSLSTGEYFYYSNFFRLGDISDSQYFYSFLMYLIYFLSYAFVVFIYIMFVGLKKVSTLSTVRKNTSELFFGWREFLVLLILSCVLLFLVKDILFYTLASGSSFYYEFRFGVDSFRKNIINLTMWSTLVVSFFYFIFSKNKIIPVLFLLFSSLLALLLGGRFHVLAIFFMYFIYYVDVNDIRIRHILIICIYMVLMLCLLMLVYIVRESSVGNALSDFSLDTFLITLASMFSTGEFMFPHYSLYTILDIDLQPSYFISFKYLVTSFLGLESLDTYTYYKNIAFPWVNVGVGISSPSGWYINMGVIGLVFGAVLHAVTLLLIYRVFIKKKSFLSYFVLLVFTVQSIFLVRSAPEAIKGAFFHNTLFPFLLLLCLNFFSKKRERNYEL